MNDTRSQTAYGGELLCARNCTVSPDAGGYVFANGNHVRHLFGPTSAHWNFAN